MQISRVQVFAFVEGGLDRPFAERMLKLFVKTDIEVRVVAIRETPTATGGKLALLKHFRQLKRKGHLLATAWGKPFVSLFFLDKDADDVLKRKIKSKHVAYTSAYDLEGSLFACGNLSHALANTCLITREQSQAMIGDISQLLHDVSNCWSDWITLCLISQFKKKNVGCTFDRTSAVNTDPLLPPDATLLRQWKKSLQVGLGITVAEFDKLYQRFNRSVLHSISSGNPLRFLRESGLTLFFKKHLNRPLKLRTQILMRPGIAPFRF